MNDKRAGQPARHSRGNSMNKTRKKHLQSIGSQLEELRDRLEELLAEEEEALLATPENLQKSERYECDQNRLTEMEYALCDIEDAISSVGIAAE